MQIDDLKPVPVVLTTGPLRRGCRSRKEAQAREAAKKSMEGQGMLVRSDREEIQAHGRSRADVARPDCERSRHRGISPMRGCRYQSVTRNLTRRRSNISSEMAKPSLTLTGSSQFVTVLGGTWRNCCRLSQAMQQVASSAVISVRQHLALMTARRRRRSSLQSCWEFVRVWPDDGCRDNSSRIAGSGFRIRARGRVLQARPYPLCLLLGTSRRPIVLKPGWHGLTCSRSGGTIK
jgi:hypothetical protein